MNNKYRLLFLLFIYPFIIFDSYCQQAYSYLLFPSVDSFATQHMVSEINSGSSVIYDDNFWISLEAGVYYLPFLLEDTFSSTIVKTEPSFTSTFSFNEFHSISLGVGIFVTKITQESIHLRTNLKFNGYHINLTYYYQLKEMITNIRPYAGIGLIYSITRNDLENAEIESQTKNWKNKNNFNGYGLEGTLGLKFELNSTLRLSTSLNLIYINGAGFSSFSHNIFDFSGIQILLGLDYNI